MCISSTPNPAASPGNRTEHGAGRVWLPVDGIALKRPGGWFNEICGPQPSRGTESLEAEMSRGFITLITRRFRERPPQHAGISVKYQKSRSLVLRETSGTGSQFEGSATWAVSDEQWRCVCVSGLPGNPVGCAGSRGGKRCHCSCQAVRNASV